MSVFLDIIILAVIVICIVRGYRLGFIRSIMGLISSVAAFAAAVYFTPSLSSVFYNKVFLPSISGEIRETLMSLFMRGGETLSPDELFAESPEALTSLLERFGVTKDSLAERFASAEAATSETVTEISKAIAAPAASAMSNIVSYFIIFTAALIILRIITVVLGAVFELPVLRTLNRTAGLILGILCALVLSVAISTALAALMKAMEPVKPTVFGTNVVENTHLVKLLAGLSPKKLYALLWPKV
ncbi:MAG: CvpA family protein [Clostridiales bacterium]|nr:CvpA family protein [Clostridiales bacterium]